MVTQHQGKWGFLQKCTDHWRQEDSSWLTCSCPGHYWVETRWIRGPLRASSAHTFCLQKGKSWERPLLKTPFCRERKIQSVSLIWCLQRLTAWQGEDPGFCRKTHKASPAHKRLTLATLPRGHQQCCWGNSKHQEWLQSFGYNRGRHGGLQSHQQGGKSWPVSNSYSKSTSGCFADTPNKVGQERFHLLT